jgi:uncharacterized protein YydD (DUF2326 family)
MLQTELAREEAAVEALRHRLQAAQTLAASARETEAARIELTAAVAVDLEERHQQTDEAILLFNEFARQLYTDARDARLSIEPGRNSLKITPKIESDESTGIGNMVIFCFDLAVAVVAHRAGRAPDFLVHDSVLFDGVDGRQLAAAFSLGAEVAERERMQYIVTINSDDLDKARALGFEGGGLFGFRF